MCVCVCVAGIGKCRSVGRCCAVIVSCVGVTCMHAARRRLSADDGAAAAAGGGYERDSELLSRTTRPAAVESLHAAAERNPAPLIGRCDAYRGDGLPGARVFSPCPTSTRCTRHLDHDTAVQRDNSVSETPENVTVAVDGLRF